MSIFTSGQSAYSRDGHKHYIRESLGGGRVLASPYLVIEGYDGEDEEYPADTAAVRLESELTAEAPREAVDAEVAKALADLAEIRQQISKTRGELAVAQREAKAELTVLEKHPKFTRLIDYLEGRITHFVVSDYYGPQIKTWDELAVYREDKRDKGVKLLTLYGDSKGNTEWNLNTYRDGSGTGHTCQPCLSYEEALEVVGEWIEADFLTFDADRPWTIAGAVKSANLYGKPVPQHIRDALTAHSEAALQRTIDDLAGKLAEAQNKLAAARGES